MDWDILKPKLTELYEKYKYPLLILLVGMVLMVLPHSAQTPEIHSVEQQITEKVSLEHSLSDILSMVDGAGRVRVLLTEYAGESTVYQTNNSSSADGNIRKDTVIISDNSRSQEGMIQRIDPPVWKGAVVLCQGAKNAVVKLQIVEAVSKATGLTYDKITVLKMK